MGNSTVPCLNVALISFFRVIVHILVRIRSSDRSRKCSSSPPYPHGETSNNRCYTSSSVSYASSASSATIPTKWRSAAPQSGWIIY